MNITLHGERDQNDGMTRKQAPCCYSCTRYAPEIFLRNYGQIKKTNCKNAHIWDGSQHQHETGFCTFRNSPHNQWNSTTMLKHQDSNISSFTKLKTPITWNFNFRFNKINKIQLTKTCLKELPGLYKTWSTTHLTSKTFSSETGYSTTTWFYESGIDWVENSRFILEWNLNASLLNQCLN